jgi:hypothetical protein
LRSKEDSSLGIFRNVKEVGELVKKQSDAIRKAIRVDPGWQDAMKAAGIWEDDKVHYED